MPVAHYFPHTHFLLKPNGYSNLRVRTEDYFQAKLCMVLNQLQPCAQKYIASSMLALKIRIHFQEQAHYVIYLAAARILTHWLDFSMMWALGHMEAEKEGNDSDDEEGREMVLSTKGRGIFSSPQIQLHTFVSYSHSFCVCIIKPNEILSVLRAGFHLPHNFTTPRNIRYKAAYSE